MKPKFFYGYIVVVASFVIQGVVWGVYQSFGVFFNPLLDEFGWSRATISGAASLSFILGGFLALIIGNLNDRFGPRIVMTGCGFFAGLGFLLMSQVNSLWQLYLFYGVILALGISGMDVLPLATIARWFTKKRGIMTGIAKVGTGLGILVIPMMASGLIFAYGWRTTYFTLGIVALVLLVSAAQLLRQAPGRRKQLSSAGNELAFGSLSLPEEGLSLHRAVHTGQFWIVGAIYLVVGFCSLTVLVHIVPHAIDLGISAASAAGVLAIIGGVSIVGRLVMGGISDIIGNNRSLFICLIILLVALVWLQSAKELWAFYLFAVLYGFAHGGVFTLISPIVAELFGIRSQGTILGTAVFTTAIGGFVGPVLAGSIFDVTGSYDLAIIILIVAGVIGVALALFLRPVRKKGVSNDL